MSSTAIRASRSADAWPSKGWSLLADERAGGRFQCAAAARDRDEPILATASQVAAWLLVEVRGPWGRDAVGQSEFGPHAPRVWREAMRRQGIRVIAIRRDLGWRDDEGLRLVHVVAGRPDGPPAVARRQVLEDLHDVVSATEALTAGHAPGSGWSDDPDRYVLVCTNGRHDPCCATFGRPLVRGLRQSSWAEQVWECSHIGGDRFAGNIVLLPDSLYFGRCDQERAKRLLAAHDAGRLDLETFRGRSTFRLPEQAAEHFVRLELGLDDLDAVLAIDRMENGRYRVVVDDAGERVTYLAAIERVAVDAPTPITCKGVEGLQYPAFRLAQLIPT